MKILNLGNIDYLEAYELQKKLVEDVYLGEPETLLVCSHPSVVTLGKKSTKEDLMGWTGPVYEIERGGQATYHGPGQVVIYPILNLKNRGQNIAGFLEAMERAMIEALKSFDLLGVGNDDRGKPDYTGVWITDQNSQPRKIASIGVAVKKWVTYHGLAFNLFEDPVAFKGISPCGFTTDTMTNLEALLSKKIERQTFEDLLTQHLITFFSKLSS
ncbi:MAG: lipoyl(octanoyl) transferase LipB [Halobacteriovoraceae bacterium]|nr:lipoyl(octanoyl) transferase LipB [Halobacteriovoraceae bacterium]